MSSNLFLKRNYLSVCNFELVHVELLSLILSHFNLHAQIINVCTADFVKVFIDLEFIIRYIHKRRSLWWVEIELSFLLLLAKAIVRYLVKICKCRSPFSLILRRHNISVLIMIRFQIINLNLLQVIYTGNLRRESIQILAINPMTQIIWLLVWN